MSDIMAFYLILAIAVLIIVLIALPTLIERARETKDRGSKKKK